MNTQYDYFYDVQFHLTAKFIMGHYNSRDLEFLNNMSHYELVELILGLNNARFPNHVTSFPPKYSYRDLEHPCRIYQELRYALKLNQPSHFKRQLQTAEIYLSPNVLFNLIELVKIVTSKDGNNLEQRLKLFLDLTYNQPKLLEQIS